MPQIREPRLAEIEEQIAAFIAKFDPEAGDLVRQCRTELRRLLPAAFELVYDNYNFFVIGYCSTAKPSTCIVSLTAAANGVGLSFYQGASLKDPEHVLQGGGSRTASSGYRRSRRCARQA